MAISWYHWLIGVIGVIGGYQLYKKNSYLAFPDYLKHCEEMAEIELKTSSDVKKTILVLEKTTEEEIAAFFYRRYEDGKIRKQKILSTSYKLKNCPADVVEAISKGYYTIKKY